MLTAIYSAVELLLIFFGIMFLSGKGTSWIAGYNTASKEEKEKIDKQKLGKYTGILMFALAACWLIVIASAVFESMILFWIGFALFISVLFAGLIYMNTGNRLSK